MNKELIRCWPISLPSIGGHLEEGHWITYPEDNSGHDLIICKNCGHLFAVNVIKMVYIGPPLAEKLKTVNCSECDCLLYDNVMQYPETYRDSLGNFLHFERETVIPEKQLSIVREFDQIY